MSTVTSRRLRKLGLTLAFIGFCAVLLPLPVQARFGHEFDWLMPRGYLFLVLVCFPWVGIAMYLIGRFQYRP